LQEDPVLHSRRSLTLKFDIPISRTHEFWDALEHGRFVTTKCAKCGQVSFPPQSDCPKCMSGEFAWVDLGREATLVTFTHVEIIPASFAEDGPYIVAICELTNGLKVLAWLEGIDYEKAKPGMRVRVVGRKSKEGNPYYVFVPA
jgi:uncharacterized OB-fold protein